MKYLFLLLTFTLSVLAIKKISWEDRLIEVNELTNKYRVTMNGKNEWSFWMAQDFRLHLKMARLDPLIDSEFNFGDNYLQHVSQSSDLQSQLLQELTIPNHKGLFLVQFHTQAFEFFQQALKDRFGAKILFPFPSQALLIELPDPTQTEEISALPFVRWVGDYLALYKIGPDMINFLKENQQTNKKVRVNLMLTERGPRLQNQLKQIIEKQYGGEVIAMITEGFRMEVRLALSQILRILARPEVHYSDIWTPAGVDMNIARIAGGLDYTARVGKYAGEGVRAEVMDSGLYTGHADFRNLNIIFHGGNSEDTSHGTSVFGIVFGQGVENPDGLGALPISQASIFAPYYILDLNYNRYQHTADLIDPNQTYHAVFQTNSWGSAQTERYTTVSAEMDDIIFIYDFTILQSQSNMGNRNSRPQAWAKNVNSIGGVRHYNTLSRGDDTWTQGASIGPSEDGRIKPDLCHYYDLVYATNNSENTYREFSGTSGATPITAGHYGILFQMWADGVFSGTPGLGRDAFEVRPHSSTVKAIMINTAQQYPFTATSSDLIRVHQGWGTPDLAAIYDIAAIHGWKFPLLIDESDPIAPQQILSYTVTVNPKDAPTFLKVTLTYRDPMPPVSASKQLINNLDLEVISPSGTLYWGNVGLFSGVCSEEEGEPSSVDNVENVFVCDAEPGEWLISVWGTEILQDTNPVENEVLDAVFSLVVTKGRNFP